MKKIIIFTLIIGLLVYGLFQYKLKSVPKPQIINIADTTSTWNEYKNEKYGYVISDPASWKIEKIENEKILILQDSDAIKSILGAYIKIFSSYDEKKDESIQDWWTANGPQNGRQAPYPDEEKIIKVGGEDAYYTLYDTESNAFGYQKLAAIFIYVGHNGKVYEISGGKLPARPQERGMTPDDIRTAQEYEKVFQQILDSFHFIN